MSLILIAGVPKLRKNLRKDAVPTVFDIPNAPKETAPRRIIIKRPCEEINLQPRKKIRGSQLYTSFKISIMNYIVLFAVAVYF